MNLFLRSLPLLLVLAVGCRKDAAPAGGPAAVSDRDLKLIGMAYHSYAAMNPGQAPQQLADLQPFLSQQPDEKKAYEQLKNGAIVFCFGAPLMELEQARTAGATVIAYDRAAPSQGGWAAMGDGTIRKFTKDEFAQAVLAKPKK